MQTKSFQLTRYFTITSFMAFALVAAALMYFEKQQGAFFRQVQDEQSGLFQRVQDGLVKQQDESAKRDLLTVHESGNVNLTRLFANTLWERDFEPFVQRARQIPVDHCRAIPDVEKDGKPQLPDEKKACFAEVGKQIIALPGFGKIDAKVFEVMRKSTVFKIKVFDLRGITIYSSEHKQIGEDKSTNAGWRGAVQGTPTSELTHREKFSAFEGVVENRDLISSYLPVFAPDGDQVVGVFETYSDVTPFLKQIKETSEQITKTVSDTQTGVQQAAAANLIKVERSALLAIIIVVALLGLLYVVLYLVVSRAQGIISGQEAERGKSQQRLSQAEKMASLGQMVAGIAHQLNTPLAFSKNNVQIAREAIGSLEGPIDAAKKLAKLYKAAPSVLTLEASQAQALQEIEACDVDVSTINAMLGDVYNGVCNMAEMVTHLQDFTRLDQSKTQSADLNKALQAVVYMARSVLPNRVELIEDYGQIPQIVCDASLLNQAFLNLINNAAQAIPGPGKVWVRTRATPDQGVQVTVEDTGSGIPADVLPKIFDLYFTTKPQGKGTGLGLHIAKDVVEQHGGRIDVRTQEGKGTVFTITLPAKTAKR
jgi:two-component system, NtrC family, sensor kinase